MSESITANSDSVDTDSIKPPTNNSTTPTGSNLALGVAFWIWGMMVSYFPSYAALPAGWTWPFRGLGYIFYGMGAVAAIFGLSNFTNSRFLQYFGTAAGFGVIAYLFHRWASDVSAFGWSLLLRVIVLVSAAGALLYLLLSIPFLFLKPQEPTPPRAMGNGAPKGVENTSGSRSRFELIAGIIIALLALLTAAIPLIKAWLKVQD